MLNLKIRMKTMKIKRLIKVVSIVKILTLITLSGCNSNKKIFDYGLVKNDIYYNSFFGLEVHLPSNWSIRTKEQLQNLAESGKNLLAGDDKNMKTIVNAVDVDNAILLGVSEYEVGAAVKYNPSLMLSVENLKNSPGVKTGSDYLYHCRKLLKQSQIQYDYIDEEFKKEVIGNQDFYLMNASINIMELNVNQIYYATIRNNFCLTVIISFIDDEQKDDLDRIVKSMKFEK